MARIDLEEAERLWKDTREKSWHGLHELIHQAEPDTRLRRLVLREVAELEREHVLFPRSGVELQETLNERLAELQV